MILRDIANFQLAQYISANIADVLSGKRNAPKKPRLVEEIGTRRKEAENPIRWYSREETEAWLEKRKLEKAKKND